jgi:hypothetical protein
MFEPCDVLNHLKRKILHAAVVYLHKSVGDFSAKRARMAPEVER